VRSLLRLLSALAVAVSLVAVCADARSAPAADRSGVIRVAFLQGEQLARVSRPGRTPRDAVAALIAGPTAAERAHGFRTYVGTGTHLRRLGVAGPVATADFNAAFASGSSERRMARVAQLVRTLTGVAGITRVQVLVNGAPPSGLVQGISFAHPITLRLLQTPNVPVPSPPQFKLGPPDPATKTLQGQLIKLGYLVRGDDDGRLGPETQDALLAFQKWEGLNRSGTLDAATKAQITNATRPTPVSMGAQGKRAEILLDRQVALLINNNRVVRAISVSTGKPSTPTPPGDYRVYAKIPRWWSTPFREWLPWAIPFVGGIAFHEFQVVPTYPASHGCVRQRFTVAQWTYGFAEVGMPVKVLATS
jgi:L,D-transpeptidase catalytic domain/Sporulation and spore germination/Putative peptidoglycan binding domain